MSEMELLDMCDAAQLHLTRMEYWPAEKMLVQAEQLAIRAKDWDSLSRLYMPLQEARRQRRQRCGEGIVRLDLYSQHASDELNVDHILSTYPQGQLIVAGWGSVEPALQLRKRACERELFVETFLACVFPTVGGGRAIVIVPHEGLSLPTPIERNIDELLRLLPPQSICLHPDHLYKGEKKGTAETYGRIMQLWEELHRPFLSAARMQVDPHQKLNLFRKTIEVDYACEFAHQEISSTARELTRAKAHS